MNVFRHRGDILARYGYRSGFLEISLSISVRERYRFIGDESLFTASSISSPASGTFEKTGLMLSSPSPEVLLLEGSGT